MNNNTGDSKDPGVSAGIGNPLSPYNGELLSVEDEKRVDDKGQLVTSGLLWSEAATGEYIWVALWSGTELTQLVTGGKGQTDISLSSVFGSQWQLSLGISTGKPRFNKNTVGAAFEIPQDLGEDSIKRQYIAEWLTETITEAFGVKGLRLSKDKTGDLAVVLGHAANRAIGTVL